MRLDPGGQSVLFDAIVFFVLMLLASTAFLSYGSYMNNHAGVYAYDDLCRYCQETGEALFETNVPIVSYVDHDGSDVMLMDRSVAFLLARESTLLDQGLKPSSFSEDYNERIKEQAARLTRDGLHFAVTCGMSLGEEATPPPVVISSDIEVEGTGSLPDVDLSTYTIVTDLGSEEGQSWISFALWR